MSATVWSAVRQRQPTGKRVSQRPAKPVKLVFLGVYRNVTRGMLLSQFCGDTLNDQKRLQYIILTAFCVACFYGSLFFLEITLRLLYLPSITFYQQKMLFMKIRTKNYLQIFKNKMVR